MFPAKKNLKTKAWFIAPLATPAFWGQDGCSGRRGNSGLNSAFDLLKYAVKIYVMENSGKLIGDEFLQEKLKASERLNLWPEWK